MGSGELSMNIEIGNVIVGSQEPCFIIAEAGVNHNGSLDLALRLVDAAVDAGANAVKFQTFKSEKVVSAGAPKAEYQVASTGNSESQLEMVRRLELSYEAFGRIYDYCQRRGILFLSTPFDEESCDFLDGLGMSAFKIPSGEITNLPFLRHIALKGKPIIMSTGMSTMAEINDALACVDATGNKKVIVLHCVSCYPASPSSVNLRVLAAMRDSLRVDIGYSDHTLGIEIPLAAVALGACLIEKHFTLDRKLTGPDHQASLEPHELKAMVEGIRKVEASLGDGLKRPTEAELKTAQCARRSLVAACDMLAGTVIADEMVAILRPGTGLPPSMKPSVVGRRLLVDLREGELFSLEKLAPGKSL